MMDITWCAEEHCPHTDCFRNMVNLKAEKGVPFSMAYLKNSDMCPIEAVDMKLTMTEFAIKYSIGYNTVHKALENARLLRRYRKNYKYDERAMLHACIDYLDDKAKEHGAKMAKFIFEKCRLDSSLNKMEQKGAED